MTNYEKILTELQNMSIEEFAKTRIFYYDTSGFYYGDFGSADKRATAIIREIEWLNENIKDNQC